jgi:hypothetical protein
MGVEATRLRVWQVRMGVLWTYFLIREWAVCTEARVKGGQVDISAIVSDEEDLDFEV